MPEKAFEISAAAANGLFARGRVPHELSQACDTLAWCAAKGESR
jgi:hypothetical protein